MYVVIEIQTNEAGEMSYLTDKEAEKSAAYQKYHTVLAAASVSKLPYHACVILDECGNTVARDYFLNGKHPDENE